MATDMTQVTYYTKEGFEKIKTELEHLIHIERPMISQQIAEARDKGDLSENAEYDAAKNAQGMLEMRISKMQDMLRNARIIDESKMDATKVQILSTVKIRNLKNNVEMTYTLVPENEADLKAGKISVSSPIAKGLLGKKKGSKVDITIPAGLITVEVIEIIIK
jgi:transcription elongation factor GreA